MEEFDNEVFKISKDKERARDLLEMAEERIDKIIESIPKELTYKLLEEYYEICVQLITSLMYSEGYKTLSHVSLIRFLSNNYDFNEAEINVLESLRKLRHGVLYYGRRSSGNFYINHKGEIVKIVNKLKTLLKKKLGRSV